jgi:3D (Asp-Asp-Asp) domain-containing protein
VAATEDLLLPRAGRVWLRSATKPGIFLAAVLVTVGSAIGAKELQGRAPVLPAAAMVSMVENARATAPAPAMGAPEDDGTTLAGTSEPENAFLEPVINDQELAPALLDYALDPNIRWFDGRPVRPVKKVWMNVSGYAPDARSCGDSADGRTATLHSVKTNNSRLAAADPKVLPYGSMLSIPGYADTTVVPVLDCGGAIKGNKLDLLFPTHEEAIKWGRKKVQVTIWAYADGRPAENPRKLR